MFWIVGTAVLDVELNSLTGKSVLGSTLCQNINLTSTRNCVETVPESYRPPGFDPRIGNFCWPNKTSSRDRDVIEPATLQFGARSVFR